MIAAVDDLIALKFINTGFLLPHLAVPFTGRYSQWRIQHIGGLSRRYVWGPPHPIFKRDQRKINYRLNGG